MRAGQQQETRVKGKRRQVERASVRRTKGQRAGIRQEPKAGRERDRGRWRGRTEKEAGVGGRAVWGRQGRAPGAGPLTCLGCSGAESAVATAYKQREGEAALSAVWPGGRAAAGRGG